MSKFIVFSDLHLHNWSYGSSIVRGRNSRLMFQQLAVMEMLDYAKSNNIDHLIFCGDFFHTHSSVSSEVLQVISEIMTVANPYVDIIFNMGNHDMASKNSLISALSIFKPYHHTVVTEPMTVLLDSPMCFIPYTDSKESLQKALERVDDDYKYIVLHQGVSNVVINSTGFSMNDLLTPDMIPPHISAAFTGHYHSHKKVSNNLWIPGSMNQLTWTDIGETRGFLEVTDTDHDVIVKQIPVSGPKFVYKTDKDFLGDIKGDFVRIDCAAGTNINAIKEEASKYMPMSLEIRVKDEKPEVVETPKTFSTIVELFHEYIETNNFSPEFVKIGKEIIDETP